jgi:hypothetical protein
MLLPIHFNFSVNISITPDVGEDNLLAIGPSKSFQTSDGDKFEKVLPRLTLPGQLRSYPDYMQIQGRGSFRMDF